ncbi:hypothetical protein [Listeria aquatica]|uniref:hypothetical protein n=1 Tax=Listeria aquatica TaxID=1494960 RepID=UPI0004ADA29A|nr:hypothetical protein [Listeria aquatica]
MQQNSLILRELTAAKKKFDFVTVNDALADLPKIKSGEGNDELDYHPDYSSLTEKQIDFITTLHGVKNGFEAPESVKYDPLKITFHKAVNHRETMIKRMSLIQKGEGMKHAADRLIRENKKRSNRKVFPQKKCMRPETDV